jgi:hypothetical protein
MGTDYDSIVQGRRRNWDALKPEEVRRKEQEEARARREEERQKRGVRFTSFHDLRRKLQEAALAEDAAKFRLALRRSAVLLGAFVILVATIIIIDRVASSRAAQAIIKGVETYDQRVENGEAIHVLDEPVGAFASWRSGWVRGDMERLVATFSPAYVGRISTKNDRSAVVAEYKRMYEAGGMTGNVALAEQFFAADAAYVPRRPWSDKSLAIFRSQVMVHEGVERIYIAAFSYHSKTGKWGFFDMREAPYFSIRWRDEGDVKPLRTGPNATRYDEEGYEIPIGDDDE